MSPFISAKLAELDLRAGEDKEQTVMKIKLQIFT
jgi:hypothetical protein